jgi:hypothetical protein
MKLGVLQSVPQVYGLTEKLSTKMISVVVMHVYGTTVALACFTFNFKDVQQMTLESPHV